MLAAFFHIRKQALVATILLMPSLVLADDWPQWRGPTRDGIVAGFAPPAEWPESLKEQWKVTVGEGHSSPVVVAGKIYLHTRQKEDEVALCLDAASGKEIWRASYPAPYEMNPAATTHGKGPKSTPVANGGKVYTLGISGILSCFDSQTGGLKWRKEFSKQYPRTSPLFGTAMSPLVENGLLIAHVGGHDKGALTAFDAETGEVKWTNRIDGPGYASPILATLAGERMLITQTQDFVIGVSPATGETFWKIPFSTEYVQNIVTPIVYKDMLIYSGYAKPVRAIRVKKKGSAMTPEEIWSNPDHSMYMSSPVLKDNLLYGMSHRQLGHIFCLDADTGKTLWQGKGRMADNVVLLNAGSSLVLLTNQAQLVFANPNGSGFEPIKQYKVADSPTWAHPVLLGNRILVKDETTLTSWAISH